MNSKVFNITIMMILGIISGYYFIYSYDYKVWLLVCVFLVMTMFYLSKKRLDNVVWAIIIYILGAIFLYISLNSSTLIKLIDDSVVLEGTVIQGKEIDENISNYIVKVKKLEYNGEKLKLNEKTRLKIIGDNFIEAGSTIKYKTKLKIPLENTNPKLYNFKKQLQSEKIHTIATIKSKDIASIKSNTKLIYKLQNMFKDNIVSLFESVLNTENSRLMISILLGDRGYLEEEEINIYQKLGLSHILAVSGLHIGIISGFLIFMLSHMGIRRNIVNVLLLIIIWGYSFLIGFPVSTLRACIMISLVILSQILIEPYSTFNNLFISMFILLIINPLYIFNLSFQLSYIAALSIIVITPYLGDIVYLYKNKLLEKLLPIISVQIGLLPIQIYYFNEVSIIGFISNLIVIPILTLGIIVGFIMVVFSYISSLPNKVLGIILNILLTGESTMVKLFSESPITTFNIRSFEIWEIIIYYLLVMILLRVIDISKLRGRLRDVVLLWIFIVLTGINILPILDKSLYIDFVDVGQGDCILIRKARNKYLIDTGGEVLGNYKISENVTLPYLVKNGHNKLNALFITHLHEDHSKGAPLLLDKLHIDNVLLSYEDSSSNIYNEIKNKGKNLRILKAGDLINIDKDFTIKVLSPNENKVASYSENNKSLVLLLEYLDYKVLLTGDMESEVENKLVNENKLGKIDIIKVPHHGSETSSSELFLKRTLPDYSVFTVGRNNLFNHPRPEILQRYEEINSNLYRTDQCGLISFSLGKNGIDVSCYLEENVKLSALDIIVVMVYFINAKIIYIFYIRDKDKERLLVEL